VGYDGAFTSYSAAAGHRGAGFPDQRHTREARADGAPSISFSDVPRARRTLVGRTMEVLVGERARNGATRAARPHATAKTVKVGRKAGGRREVDVRSMVSPRTTISGTTPPQPHRLAIAEGRADELIRAFGRTAVGSRVAITVADGLRERGRTRGGQLRLDPVYGDGDAQRGAPATRRIEDTSIGSSQFVDPRGGG